MENDHRAGHVAATVADGGGRILNRSFNSIAPNQDTVYVEANRLVLLNGDVHGIAQSFAGHAIDDAEHLGERLPYGIPLRSAGHPFRHSIQVGDIADDIGADDSITNGVERDLGAFLFNE